MHVDTGTRPPVVATGHHVDRRSRCCRLMQHSKDWNRPCICCRTRDCRKHRHPMRTRSSMSRHWWWCRARKQPQTSGSTHPAPSAPIDCLHGRLCSIRPSGAIAQWPKIPSTAKMRWLTHPASHVWIVGPVRALSHGSLSREIEIRQKREWKWKRREKGR